MGAQVDGAVEAAVEPGRQVPVSWWVEAPQALGKVSPPLLTALLLVIGSVVDVIQIGRLPSGEPAAVLRASQRARIGHGVTGTGVRRRLEGADRHHVFGADAEERNLVILSPRRSLFMRRNGAE